jgi:hypothetical protein
MAAQGGQVNQINGHTIVNQFNVAVVQHLIGQSLGNGLAGGVSHMNHAPVGMTAFTGEVQGIALGIKVHPPFG